MTSRGGLPLRLMRLKNVVLAIALAAGWIGVLFLCASRGAPALSASGGPEADAASGARGWAEGGDIAATWTSTQPVTTVVGPEPYVWPITQHGVTVTFYRDAVGATAWFTFTPKPPADLPIGYDSTPYVFDLDGEYQASRRPVSLGATGIQIELNYDVAQLGGIDERTLRFFHFGKTDWVDHGGDLDLYAKTLTLKTERTQSFAVGGELPKQYIYLSIVFRN